MIGRKKDLRYIKKILSKFKKRVIINNKNLGVAKSRNIAIHHAKKLSGLY